MNNTKGVIAYLPLAFGIAWANWEFVLRHGFAVDNPLFKVLAMPGAVAPAIAAFIVRMWITREGFADAGLKIDITKWPYYLVAFFLPLVVVGSLVVLSPLFGFGSADFTLARGLREAMPHGVPPPLLEHPWIVVLSLPINALFATPILFGEEFGWRSYLQLRLFPERPVLAAVATGIIWGVWHYPINLRGYNYPDHRLVGLIVFPIATIFLSIIFGWLRMKTRSIWCPSLAHAATNAIGGSLLLLLLGSKNAIFTSYAGILGYVPLGLLSAWIVFTGQLKPAASAPGQDGMQAVQAGA